MSVNIILQDSDIIIYHATTDVGTFKYKYLPKQQKYYAFDGREWVEIDEGDIGVIEYYEYRTAELGL